MNRYQSSEAAPRSISLALIVLLLVLSTGASTPSPAAYATGSPQTAQDKIKGMYLDHVSEYMSEFDGTAFGQVITLGDIKRFRAAALTDNLRVHIDYKFSMPGKFFPPNSRVAGGLAGIDFRGCILVVASLSEERDYVTLWHEFLHYMIYLAGKEPCGKEEAYTEICEVRVSWLRKLMAFDRQYKSGAVSSTELKRRWNDLELEWNNLGLSGPFFWKDQDSCGDPGRTYQIDPAYIQRLDKLVGITIDISKIRPLYGDEAATLAKLEEQVAALEKTKADLIKTVDSAKKDAEKATKAEDDAKTLLGKLNDLKPIVDDSAKICQDAAARGKEIQTKVTEAEKLGTVFRDTLDEASRIAADCSTKNAAADIRDLFKNSLRVVGEIGVVKKEAEKINSDFPALVVSLANKMTKLKDAPKLVKDVSDQSTAADAALKSALKNSPSILEGQFRRGQLLISSQVSPQLEKFVTDYPGALPAGMQNRVDQLRVRLAGLLKNVSIGDSAAIAARDAKLTQDHKTDAITVAQKYQDSLCVITPMDDAVEQIDGVLTAATLALHAASDLPRKGQECEARADCLLQMNPIKNLLQNGDTEKASPLINKLKAQGCDTKEIEDEYWRVQAMVWPLLTRARDAVNSLATSCDYQAARKAAEDLQDAFPQHPWVVENLRTVQQGATAQFEVNDLLHKAEGAEGTWTVSHDVSPLSPIYVQSSPSNPAAADAAIARAAQVAAPYPCLSKKVDRFKSQFEKGRSLANRIGSLRARINELGTKKASAQSNAQQAANSADQAAQLLAQLYGYDDQISAIADKCRLASTLRASVESANRDALAQEKTIRSDLDDGIAKAANCTNKRDAADVQAKYNNAIRTVGQVGAAARAARQTNQGDLQSLLSDINNGKGAYQRANELADRLAEACGKVSSAVDATRADVQSGEALKANFSSVAVGLRAEIDKLRTDYPVDPIDEVSTLYSLLDSALADSNNISFAGVVIAAEAQATRCDGLRSSAQAQLQKYQNAVACNVTTADDLVEQMDGVVTGLTVELGAAADAAKKATNCLASLNSTSAGADKGKDPASANDVPDWIKNTIKGNEVLGYPVSNKPDKLPSDDVPDFVGNTGKGTKPATDDVPDFVGNTGKGTKPRSDVVPDFVGNTGRGTKAAADDVPDFVGNTGRGSKPTDNAPDFVGNTGKPAAKPPGNIEAPQGTGSLPAGMTVCHKRACIWPTTLKLVKQTGDSGEYSGASFQGYPVTATVHLYSDGRLVIEIQCRTNGYSGSYSGQRKGNVVEGEYTPSAGFGPRDYFKASW